MRRDVFDLMSYAVSKGLRTSLTPSATALANPKNLARVCDTGVLRLAVSLDGPTAEVHDAFRGFRGTFDRTMGILRDAREVGLALQINTTVSRYNLAVLDQMPEIVSQSGAVQWSVFFLVPTGRGKQNDMISAEEHERSSTGCTISHARRRSTSRARPPRLPACSDSKSTSGSRRIRPAPGGRRGLPVR
jgi:MoaA/NifB/PqqE/SkfB family radical SAM enzyme